MEPCELARWKEIAEFSPEQLAGFMERGRAMDEKFGRLAESMRGGGHAQACGFKIEADRLPELLGGQFKSTP
ncbi:MAG: hypothetical protein A3F78_10175 [Burkholderiales bacterium RIFCSPLOWO2_12_FULL_61_40]|nr:MAG: hypothetical protein A3F78_10175 [Burkholderiales bacterium RIFCSPLOWO2_12_FULL_61_40]